MRALLLLLAALALASPALAQDTNGTATGNETAATNETASEEAAGPLTVVLEGHQDGAATYFLDPATGAKNPTIQAKPGQEVRITLRVVSGFHNLNVDNKAKSKIIGPDAEETVSFTMPESGTLQYWCDPHKTQGMAGRIALEGAAPGGGGEQGAITGETVDLGQYGAACAGRVAPKAATEGIVGMPTLQDYIDACTAREGPVVQAKHAADYVLPASWLLIGLGIVGVVYVHKYYKP